MLLFTRKELGCKGLAICVPIGLALLAGLLFFPPALAYVVVGQTLLDIILLLVLFGGDIRIN